MYTSTNNCSLLIRMANFLAPRRSQGTFSFSPSRGSAVETNHNEYIMKNSTHKLDRQEPGVAVNYR